MTMSICEVYKKKFIKLYIYILMMLLIFKGECHAAESTQVNVWMGDSMQVSQGENVEQLSDEIGRGMEALKIDLGNYKASMEVGEIQYLAVMFLPQNNREQDVLYDSSDTKVASIDKTGRITAISQGQTTITVTCGNLVSSFVLTVTNGENEIIKVTELDVGDCPSEIMVGASEMISVLAIPANATIQEFVYESDNPSVASINALGRIRGNEEGIAKITVKCGDISNSFFIKVVSAENMVTDIEIGNYRDEVEIGSTLTISTTILPADIQGNVTYKSSDSSIATVSSTGEVLGIAQGDVIIYISAGKVTKEVKLKVKVGTNNIELNRDYLALKIGDTFQINAIAQPCGASSKFTYKSIDETVAIVSASGKIDAKGIGNTAIIISNGEMQVALSVFVNEVACYSEIENVSNVKDISERNIYPEEVTVEEYPVIKKDMLMYFYKNKKKLTICGEGYIIFLDGKDIVNFDNELITELKIQKTDSGFEFLVNDGNKLCGKLTINIGQLICDEKYLYLYSNSKDKYEHVEESNIINVVIDTEGKYLVSSKKLGNVKKMTPFIVSAIIIVLLLVVYIVTKKKYWFW